MGSTKAVDAVNRDTDARYKEKWKGLHSQPEKGQDFITASPEWDSER